MVNEEVSILKNVCHDNILSMISAYQGGNEVIVVTEFLQGGELFEKVASDDYHLTEMQCVQFMHQICEGVSYLHRKVCKSPFPIPRHISFLFFSGHCSFRFEARKCGLGLAGFQQD